jgi:hypothetical protein
VFGNSVLKRTFGPKRDEVTGGWRTQHNEELHTLNSSPNIIRMLKSRRMRWMGHAVHMKIRNSYNILVGKPEGKRPLGRPRYRWKDNIKMFVTETGLDSVGWIHLAQDGDQWQALVNTVVNLWLP